MLTTEDVYSTPWFVVVAKYAEDDSTGEPYYSLRQKDYVCVIALTEERELLLVRQFRPAVERCILELPAGHVEEGDTPEEAARQELREETGYLAESLELLGRVSPDPGRLANAMWCFFAADVKPAPGFWTPEHGVACVTKPLQEFWRHLPESEFESALHLAALMMAVVAGKITVPFHSILLIQVHIPRGVLNE